MGTELDAAALVHDHATARRTQWIPISAARDEEHVVSPGGASTYARYDPLQLAAQAELEAQRRARLAPHIPALPTRAPLIAPGVLADGRFTVDYPAVRNFLDDARSHPGEDIRIPEHNIVFVLAALSVFYRPQHPAHWLFWRREVQAQTVSIVETMLDMVPCPIESPIAWANLYHNLYELRLVHKNCKEYMDTVPWFTSAFFAGYAYSESSRSRTLRKRKAAPPPGAFKEPPLNDVFDDGEGIPIVIPTKKRVRRRRDSAARAPPVQEESSPRLALPAEIEATKFESAASPSDPIPHPASRSASPSADQGQQEGATASRKRKRTASPVEDDAQVQEDEITAARRRSSSSTSTQTVVAPATPKGRGGRRPRARSNSSSAMSAADTIVDPRSPIDMKGKGKAFDYAVDDETYADEERKVHEEDDEGAEEGSADERPKFRVINIFSTPPPMEGRTRSSNRSQTGDDASGQPRPNYKDLARPAKRRRRGRMSNASDLTMIGDSIE